MILLQICTHKSKTNANGMLVAMADGGSTKRQLQHVSVHEGPCPDYLIYFQSFPTFSLFRGTQSYFFHLVLQMFSFSLADFKVGP